MIRRFLDHQPQLADQTYVADSAQVIGRVRLEAGASVWDCAVLRGDMDDIVVGENSNIQDGAVVHNTQGLPVVVGRNVTIGHRVVLHSCTIGDNSLIGMGAVVLDGAKVGSNCLIGAGALVTANTVIPDGMMALGSPAKVVKPLSEAMVSANLANAAEYVKLAREHLLGACNDG
jgi:carbonic anhydrase/acetyltransferase-like protein (isoleucine patch superfamily)